MKSGRIYGELAAFARFDHVHGIPQRSQRLCDELRRKGASSVEQLLGELGGREEVAGT